MTQDDRMETITDPAVIRACDEPDERGDFPCCADRAHKESLGGDSESGTYNRSSRPPAGPRPDADNPWALLPDDHPKRPKQCGGCGTKWVDAELLRACERRHGDDITTPAPVGAAVALDLDAVEAEFLRQCGGCDAGLMMGCTCSQRDFRPTMLALVAEVRRLTAEAATQREWFEAADAAAERRLDQSIAWMERAEAAEAEVVTLRARLAAVEALADQWADRKRSDGMSGNAWIGLTLSGVAADLRAALATTGEGQ